MKTKIKTLITICLFAFYGIAANATAVYSGVKNSTVVDEKKNDKGLKADENLTVLNEKTETIENNFVVNEVVDFQKEAEMIIKNIADQEESRAIQALTNKSITDQKVSYTEVLSADNDESLDAGKVTRLIADQVEAKAIQKLVGEGKL